MVSSYRSVKSAASSSDSGPDREVSASDDHVQRYSPGLALRVTWAPRILPAMQHIKGACQSRLAFVQEHFGKEGVQRVLDGLPTADQRMLRMLSPPTGTLSPSVRHWTTGIVRVLGEGKTESLSGWARHGRKESRERPRGLPHQR